MAPPYPRRLRHRRPSPVFGALVSTLLAGGLALAVPGDVASAATVGTPTPIVGGQSGRCLDVPNGTDVVGTQLQIWDCNGSAAQVLAPRPGNPIVFTGLTNVCVGARSGSQVQVQACDAGASDQLWNVAQNADQTLSVKIVSGECLDVASSGTANGSKVQLWGCNGTGAQKWRLQSNNTLINPQSGRCLDVPNGTTTPGTQLQIWDCNGGAAQVLRLP